MRLLMLLMGDRLWNELSTVYGVKRSTACFLSIGTGIPANEALSDIPHTLWTLPKVPTFISNLSSVPSNTQMMHLLFSALLDAYAPSPGTHKYFRLNVGQDRAHDDDETSGDTFVDLGAMDDLSKRGVLEKLTEEYVDAPGQRVIIGEVVDAIKGSLGMK